MSKSDKKRPGARRANERSASKAPPRLDVAPSAPAAPAGRPSARPRTSRSTPGTVATPDASTMPRASEPAETRVEAPARPSKPSARRSSPGTVTAREEPTLHAKSRPEPSARRKPSALRPSREVVDASDVDEAEIVPPTPAVEVAVFASMLPGAPSIAPAAPSATSLEPAPDAPDATDEDDDVRGEFDIGDTATAHPTHSEAPEDENDDVAASETGVEFLSLNAPPIDSDDPELATAAVVPSSFEAVYAPSDTAGPPAPEERLDQLLDDAARAADDPVARRRMAEAFSEIAQHLGADEVATADEGILATAREFLRPDYYMRQWGRVAMRHRSEEVDDFGLDRAYEERARPWLDGLYRRWFRVQAHGLEHVPSDGRVLVVANHAGALPWDGLMLKTALRLEHAAHRELRWLTEDFVAHTPFLGTITNRLGAVRACPENAERLLAEERVVAVFPEGEKGLGKPWAKRYEIQRFGRGGFVKLALRTGTPIVPCAIVGSEETHPLLLRTDRFARMLGVPFVPVTPTFPWLGPLGLVPLPSRWVIRFGEPIDLSHEPASTLHDVVRVQHLAEEVRSTVQTLVKRALEERPSAF